MADITISSVNFSGFNADFTFYPFTGGTISLGNHTIPYTRTSDNYEGVYDMDITWTDGIPVNCSVQIGASDCVDIETSGATYDYGGVYTYIGQGYLSYDSGTGQWAVICNDTDPKSAALYYLEGSNGQFLGNVFDVVARTTEPRITTFLLLIGLGCGSSTPFTPPSGVVSEIPTYVNGLPAEGTYANGGDSGGTYTLANNPSCIIPSPTPTPSASLTPTPTITPTTTPTTTPTPTPSPSIPAETFISATGGTETIINDGGVDYKVHSFTNTGTTSFNISSLGSSTLNNTIEYLLVAGGGGGGGSTANAGGGGAGGAGGVLTGSTIMSSTGLYSAIVGSGGIGITNTATQGGNGTDSSWNSIIATGGGGGGTALNQNGNNGGSGGGHGARTNTTPQSGTGIAGQGFSGGTNPSSGTRPAGASGGGASQSAINGVDLGSGVITSGTGGDGILSSINGTATYYGGGGGGSAWDPSVSSATRVGIGGLGGGGNGYDGTTAAQNGQTNTGGGGGGGGITIKGGDGGSGIIILRYRI